MHQKGTDQAHALQAEICTAHKQGTAERQNRQTLPKGSNVDGPLVQNIHSVHMRRRVPLRHIQYVLPTCLGTY